MTLWRRLIMFIYINILKYKFMFDDLNNQNPINNQNNQFNQGAPAGLQPPVGALPNRPDQAFAQSKTEKSVDDIFSATEKPVKPAAFQPKPQEAAELAGGGSEPGKADMKKYLLLSAMILILALIGYGGYVMFDKFRSQSANEAVDTTGGADAGGLEMENNRQEAAEPAAQNQAVQPLDSDQDGLSDEEEKALGLNANSVDSDDDGLFDREEANIYKTNPLVADTDGDGYSDGAEVKNGFNPKGPGKLFEIK